MGMKPTVPDDGALQQQIGTAYDVVKSVADNLKDLLELKDQFDEFGSTYVPNSRTINGKPLSADVNLNAGDVGARVSSWVPTWAEVASKPTSMAQLGFSLLSTDIPNIDTGKLTSGTLPAARGGTGRTDNKAAALITPVTITVGSTGKSFDGSAAVAWTLAELGAQAVNANLTSFSALTGVADRLAYFTGPNTIALTTFTAFGRSVAAAVNAAAVNTLLDVQTKADTDLVAELFNSATYDLDFVKGIYKEYRGRYLYQIPLLEAVVCNRNGTATANGPNVVNTFDVNEPRIAYDPVTGRRLGLLGEESRTNLLLHSQYTAASGETPPTGWNMGATTGTTTTAASSRFAGAIRATQSGTSQREYYTQAVTLAAATTYTLSCYFAAGTAANDKVLAVTTNDTPSGVTSLDGSAVLSAGTYSITFTTVAGGTYSVRVGLGCFANATGAVIHETPQLEVGPAFTSYIPTTTAALQRQSDVINEPLTFTNANAGAIFIEFDLTSYDKASGQATIVKLNSTGNAGNRGFGLTVTNNNFIANIRNDTNNASLALAVADTLLPAKAVVSFDNASLKLLIAVNGVSSEATITSAVDLVSYMSTIFVSGASGMSGTFVVHSKTVKRCTYFPRSFTAAEAAAITK